MSGSTSVHLSIDVPDLDSGLKFYCSVFGFTERSRPFPTMAIMSASNMSICVHQKAAGSSPAPKTEDLRRYLRHWTPVHADFHVSDFESTVAAAKKEGAVIEQTFSSVPGRPSVAFCSDPFGNGFCIIEEKKKESESGEEKSKRAKTDES